MKGAGFFKQEKSRSSFKLNLVGVEAVSELQKGTYERLFFFSFCASPVSKYSIQLHFNKFTAVFLVHVMTGLHRTPQYTLIFHARAAGWEKMIIANDGSSTRLIFYGTN